jgi:thermostable 8-oxoguanine DNA glycosylase
MRRNPSFKMKSASDFMVDLGLSHDVIALDLRIVGFLNTYLDFDQKVEKIQSNKKFYTLIESSLRKECEKLNIKLSVLDRIIFNYLNISAFDYMYLKINLS